MKVKPEYVRELSKIGRLIERDGIIHGFKFDLISFKFLVEFFENLGFKAIKRVEGKKRTDLYDAPIHVILTQSAQASIKKISIHRDTEHHHAKKLTQRQRNILKDAIQKSL